MGAHQLGNHVFRANDQGSAGIAVVLFLYRVRLPHARVASTHQEKFAGFGQIQGGQEGRGPGAQRIRKIQGPQLFIRIQDGGHGGRGLFLPVGRGR